MKFLTGGLAGMALIVFTATAAAADDARGKKMLEAIEFLTGYSAAELNLTVTIRSFPLW